MGAGNPFYDVHAAIWTKLVAVSDFATYVPSGNRIDFTASPEDILALTTEPATGRPEVAVVDAGSVVGDRVASHSSRIVRQWEIWLRGCGRDVDLYFTICFAIVRAMLDWDNESTGLKRLTWSTYGGSVRNCDLRGSQESVLGKLDISQRQGWSAKWVGRTDMWFGHTDLVG